MGAHPYWGSGPPAQPARHTISPHIRRVSTMDANSQSPNRQDNVLTLLDVAVEATNLAKEAMSAAPTKAIFGSVSIILTMIRVRFSRLLRGTFGSHVIRTP